MNGAESVVHAAASVGLDICFANPGTTEVHILGGMNAEPRIRPVLGLFEGVCTGAADGFARMAERPAMTLLHLGPGLANGIANLHNARKAEVPVVNVIGTHATRHMNHESMLSSNVPALAQAVSIFVRETRVPEDAAADLVDARNAAIEQRGVATLILPTDVQWSEVPEHPRRSAQLWKPTFDAERIEEAATRLKAAAARGALMIGGAGLHEAGLRAAGRVQAATGCRLFCKRQPTRIESGPEIPVIERLGYFPDESAAQLASITDIVLVGTEEPVSIFAYRDGRTHVLPHESRVHPVARVGDDVVGALEGLADCLGGPDSAADVHQPVRPPVGTREQRLSERLAAIMPDRAIFVDEAITSAPDVFEHAMGRTRFTYLGLTGGSIGIAGPLAVGAAVAEPDRPVVAVVGDGSALYTLQALWTQAREGLNVTTVVCANNRYRILGVEQARAGIEENTGRVDALMDLSLPTIDWLRLAAGFGVPATRARDLEGLRTQFAGSLSEAGPHLIQLDVDEI
ncbi:acetolactate synthase large subunit [Nocardioides terrisoli]|uniref:acetolactate synthase large subunit n=1 Tax=Nocardioides terrisoli TaxID=3388267 RepID=UPI00287BB5A6|nr:acetolactate synthase large subunit [Nocardioides marmorisolisilvae]